MKTLLLTAFITLVSISSSLIAGGLTTNSEAQAQVYIIEPSDGATVSETFTVSFVLSGMGVAPAGIDVANTGHHHLLIDSTELPDTTQPLPANEHVRHFGKGQTETELTLSPGVHTLQLLMGNYLHIPHEQPVISETITITVE